MNEILCLIVDPAVGLVYCVSVRTVIKGGIAPLLTEVPGARSVVGQKKRQIPGIKLLDFCRT